MTPTPRLSTQELGLILGAKLLKTDDLHYGFWNGGMEVSFANIGAAQEAYTEFLMGRIPAGVETVLDVGCGTGALAKRLIERGYRVECLTPSETLADLAQLRLGPEVKIYRETFEGLQAAGPYDLVLCAESFQYLKQTGAFRKAAELLRPGGHLLICDFFKRDDARKSALGGGHRLARFHRIRGEFPFELVDEQDITAETAPNMIIADRLLTEYALPIWDSLRRYLRANYPKLCWIAAKLFAKRLDRIESRILGRHLDPAEFERSKAYKLFLLRRTG